MLLFLDFLERIEIMTTLVSLLGRTVFKIKILVTEKSQWQREKMGAEGLESPISFKEATSRSNNKVRSFLENDGHGGNPKNHL